MCYIKNMPYRSVPLVNNEYYHVYNRGVNKRKIFLEEHDYKRAIDTFEFYSLSSHTTRYSYYSKFSPQDRKNYLKNHIEAQVEIIAFALMPNHFHFLLTQVENNGISNFLRLFQNSYTRYFNTKHNRIGHLFQGQFKAVLVETNEQLLHLSRYIHLNPFSSGVVRSLKELEKYPWNSYTSYFNSTTNSQNSIVMGQFSDINQYRNFVHDQADYQQKLDIIKHLTLD